jgi:hypothetical protein
MDVIRFARIDLGIVITIDERRARADPAAPRDEPELSRAPPGVTAASNRRWTCASVRSGSSKRAPDATALRAGPI